MKIKSTKAWSCNGSLTICQRRFCYPSGECRPVRVYPEKVARLMERACRLVNDSPMRGDMESWRKQWAKLNKEGRT